MVKWVGHQNSKIFNIRNFFFCFYNVILTMKSYAGKSGLLQHGKMFHFFNQMLFPFFSARERVPSTTQRRILRYMVWLVNTLYGSECRFFTLYFESDCREEEKKRQNMAKWGGHQNSKNSNFVRFISQYLKRNFAIYCKYAVETWSKTFFSKMFSLFIIALFLFLFWREREPGTTQRRILRLCYYDLG